MIVLGVGDIVPADIRVLEASDLKVNEMLLTGEPDDVAKTHKVNSNSSTASAGNPEHGGEEKLTPASMAFSSCMVTNGKCTGVVTDVGMKTRVGAIATMLSGQKAELQCGFLPDPTANNTPLQTSLQDLGMKIGYLAIAVCTTVFLVGWALGRKDETDEEKPSALYMILVAVTLAVAAIPEGIPLCVTISLSSGANAMVEQSVLVRKLAAVETLGSASVICTDKTGTLTEGKMTLVKMWSGGKSYCVSGAGFDPNVGKVYPADDPMTIPHNMSGRNALGLTSSQSGTKLVPKSAVPGEGKDDSGQVEPSVRSTLLAGLICSNTRIEQDPETKYWYPKGNSSEAPIVVAAAKVGFWEKDVGAEFKRVLEIPFNSSRKMMLTVVELNSTTLGAKGIAFPEGSKYMVVVKGAPNIIVDACKHWTTQKGDMADFGDKERADVMDEVDHLSSQALRVLAIAIRCLKELPFDLNNDEVSTDDKFKALVQSSTGVRLMGLVASIDPPREGVLEAVRTANEGGIKVVMITGDYFKTAVAIAKNIQIVLSEDLIEESSGNVLMPRDDDESRVALDCSGLRPDGAYLEDPEMDLLTSRVKVFARAKPEDKLEIVKSLQRQGLVCAMTGDGVNDAPALKKSDIGVAMGIYMVRIGRNTKILGPMTK